jgi:hypothetical protein
MELATTPSDAVPDQQRGHLHALHGVLVRRVVLGRGHCHWRIQWQSGRGPPASVQGAQPVITD